MTGLLTVATVTHRSVGGTHEENAHENHRPGQVNPFSSSREIVRPSISKTSGSSGPARRAPDARFGNRHRGRRLSDVPYDTAVDETELT